MKKTAILGLLAIALIACKEESKETVTVTEETTETTTAPETKEVEQTEFSKVLNLQGVEFDVTSSGNNGSHVLTVKTKGLEAQEYNETMDIGGNKVIGAETEDLNSDGSPELVVYTKDPNNNDAGNVYAFSVNSKKSMSMVNFPSTKSNSKINEGYRGRDEFSLIETTLGQRFPIYKEGDSNDNPTGGTRQVNYKLVEGEASRQFQVSSVDNY